MRLPGCSSYRAVDIAQHCEKLIDRYGITSKSASINIVADTIHTFLPRNEVSARGQGTELNNVYKEHKDCHTINNVSENSTKKTIDRNLSRSEFDTFHLGKGKANSPVPNCKEHEGLDSSNNMSIKTVANNVYLPSSGCELTQQTEDTHDRELANSNVPNNSSTNTVATGIHESLPVFIDNGKIFLL